LLHRDHWRSLGRAEFRRDGGVSELAADNNSDVPNPAPTSALM
jgi:hypothetical protein